MDLIILKKDLIISLVVLSLSLILLLLIILYKNTREELAISTPAFNVLFILGVICVIEVIVLFI